MSADTSFSSKPATAFLKFFPLVSIASPIVQVLLIIFSPVFPNTSPVFSAHFTICCPHFCTALAHTKFASTSRDTPILSRFRFCSGVCELYQSFAACILGLANSHTTCFVSGLSSSIPSCIHCPRTQDIGEKAVSNAPAPPRIAASAILYFPVANPSPASPIRLIPFFAHSRVFENAPHKNDSSGLGASILLKAPD